MIELGQTKDGTKIRLDVERLIGTRMLLQANSGGGKSWAIRRLLERTHGKVQQIVIDPEGEFYTLREKFDYVLCGKGGDCPAEPRSAALLSRRLLELGCSAVLDIHELKIGERKRFVRLFLEALVDAPRKLWHPALIVIDEAHTFAPQVGQAESLGAVCDLMSRGRKRGFCGILATQRISKLHKDAAAEANNVFIGRSRQDVDRKRAADELGFTTREDARRLVGLDHEFFSFGPAIEPGEVSRMRFGTVTTAHPEGGGAAPAVAAPRAKVKALLGELADLPAEAQEEARTVESLRAKVRDLEGEARRAAKAAPKVPEADIEKICGEARARAQASADESIGEIQAQARELAKGVREALDSLTMIADQADELIAAEIVVPVPVASKPKEWNCVGRLRVESALGRVQNELPDSEITGPMQRILDALAWLDSAGIPGPYSKVQVAFLARYSHKGGGFNNPLGRLRSAGLVDYPRSGWIVLTEEGNACSNAPGTPLTSDEMQARVREIVDGPMWRILEPLIDAYPEPMTKTDLAEAAGYTVGGGGFNNPLGRLRSLGLIGYPSPSQAVALPVLFP